MSIWVLYRKKKKKRKPNSSLQLRVAGEVRCGEYFLQQEDEVQRGAPRGSTGEVSMAAGGGTATGRGCGCAVETLPRFGWRNDQNPHFPREVCRAFLRAEASGGQDLQVCSPWLFPCLAWLTFPLDIVICSVCGTFSPCSQQPLWVLPKHTHDTGGGLDSIHASDGQSTLHNFT